MGFKKKSNGVNRSVNVRNKRVSPSLAKIRNSIAISRWLWGKIDDYSQKYRVNNRSQVIERGMMEFLSKEINETIAELKATKIKAAMLEQQIRNSKEIKQLVEDSS